MKLYPISSFGIKAYCSDMIVDPDDLETVFFMSICGYQATVKGIVASLIENHGVSINTEKTEHDLMRSNLTYKIQQKKLPSGRVHALVFPKLALANHDDEDQNSFFIFTTNGESESLLHLFYRHLDQKTQVPLHPSWKNWLWQTFDQQNNWIMTLRTLVGSYQGYRFSFNSSRLHDLVSKAIKNKDPGVISCMRYKGGINE